MKLRLIIPIFMAALLLGSFGAQAQFAQFGVGGNGSQFTKFGGSGGSGGSGITSVGPCTGPACSLVQIGAVAIGGDVSTNTVTTTYQDFMGTLASRFSFIDVKADYGAKGTTLSYADGTMSASSNQICSATATFNSGMVGWPIFISGSASASGIGSGQTGTIANYVSTHCVTASFTATLPTPWYGVYLGAPSVIGTGTGNYIPGTSIVTLAVGTGNPEASLLVTDTQVRTDNIAVANVGTGGTPGACVLTGTTGAQRANGLKNLVSINVTIGGGGGISSLGSFVTQGDYTTNPTTLSAEPVTSTCGLTGATLNMTMGVKSLVTYTYGNYQTAPTGVVNTTTTGGGTGVTLTVTGDNTQLGGIVTFGPDDSSEIAAAFTAANAAAASGVPVEVKLGGYPQTYLLRSTALPLLNNLVTVEGDGVNLTRLVPTPDNASGYIVGVADSWDGSIPFTWPYGGSSQPISSITAGTQLRGFSVHGTRWSASRQDAFLFGDHEDRLKGYDLGAYYMNGSCFRWGIEINDTSAYFRESTLDQIRCEDSGNYAGAAGLEWASATNAGSNDNTFSNIRIFAPYGPGFLIHAGTGSILGGNSFVRGLLIEGLAWGGEPGSAVPIPYPLMQIGDSGSAFCGTPNSIVFSGVQLVDPYPGQAAYYQPFNSTCNNRPYGIIVDHLAVRGGIPLGRGLDIEAGISSVYNIDSISSYDTNLTVGAAQGTGTGGVGGDMLFEGGFLTAPFTSSVDPTSNVNIQTPSYNVGNPALVGGTTGNARGGGALVNLASGATFNTGFGQNAGANVATSGAGVYFGTNACENGDVGTRVCLGSSAGIWLEAAGVAVGAGALGGNTSSPITGVNNDAFGNAALAALQGTSTKNMALGDYAGASLITGNNNTFLGYNTASSLTGGSSNFIACAAADVPAASTSYYINVCGAITGFYNAIGGTTGLSFNVPVLIPSIVSAPYLVTNSGGQIVAGTGTPAIVLSGTTGSIGGSALLAGACSAGTVTITGATTAMDAHATPVTYPTDGSYWLAYVSAANTVTVKICAAVAETPTASVYNVRVIQ